MAAAVAGQAARRSEARALVTLPSGWRNNTVDRQELTFAVPGREVVVAYRMSRRGRSVAEVVLDGQALDLAASDVRPDGVTMTVDGVTRRYAVQRSSTWTVPMVPAD